MAGYNKLISLVKEHLDKDESILKSAYGTYETKILGADSVRSGVFIATERRVVLFGKKTFGFEIESFLYKNISSFEVSKGFMGSTIKIISSGNFAKMKWIQKGDVQGFKQLVNSKMNEPSSSPNPPGNSESIYDQIEKLYGLKQKGIITEEEFLSQKSKLLNS